MQITKISMQIHANCMLIICQKKIGKFECGGAGDTYVNILRVKKFPPNPVLYTYNVIRVIIILLLFAIYVEKKIKNIFYIMYR